MGASPEASSAGSGRLSAEDAARLVAAIEEERARTVQQIASLQDSFGSIVEGAELTSTDDEHDPEGTTIAYERAQVSALLQQAKEDLVAFDDALNRVADGTAGACSVCGGPIDPRRLLALPNVRTCIDCAR